jgi:hypothetical protein
MEGDENSHTVEKERVNICKVDAVAKLSVSPSQPQIILRTIPHPECLPLYPMGFECFRSLRFFPNEFLQGKYSNGIRLTVLNLLALVDHTPDDYFQLHFANLEASIKRCIPACEKWKHVARYLFSELEMLYSPSSYSLENLKAQVKKIVETFVETLKQSEDIDSLEMRLLCMREHTGYDVDEILEVVRKLRRHNRDFIAVHYLLSLAKQVPNIEDSTRLCATAQYLDIYPFATARVMKNLYGGNFIAESKCIPFDLENNIYVIKAALRYMFLEEFDSTFVLSLANYLIRADNKDTAIHYLLRISDKFSSSNPSLSKKILHLAKKTYKARTKKTGSTKVNDDASKSVTTITLQKNN